MNRDKEFLAFCEAQPPKVLYPQDDVNFCALAKFGLVVNSCTCEDYGISLPVYAAAVSSPAYPSSSYFSFGALTARLREIVR